MPELAIHIGHGKTGTSYLQHTLAKNRHVLKMHGFHYPEHGSDEYAIQARVNSGNGQALLNENFSVQQDTLVSSERLFHSLGRDEAIESLMQRHHCRIRVILYTRNVFELLVSVWGQYVKRAGYTEDLNTFLLQKGDKHYERVLYWIQASKKYGFEITIRNYSTHKGHILDDFMHVVFGSHAEAIQNDFPAYEPAIVNRSLTVGEYDLQIEFNKQNLQGASFISDSLVDSLPHIWAEMPYITPEVYTLVVQWISDTVVEIDRYLDADEHIRIESYEELRPLMRAQDSSELTLKSDQVRVIVNAIAEELRSRQRRILRYADAIALRDMAISIERGETLTLEDAYFMMQLARRVRPNGSIIRAKCEHYAQRLKQAGNCSGRGAR